MTQVTDKSLPVQTEHTIDCDRPGRTTWRGRVIPVAKRRQVKALKESGLSTRVIARRAKVSVGSVHNILQGKKPKRRKPAKDANEEMHTIAKRYKLPAAVVKQIREVAPIHGSQGRALQLAAELLVRLTRPLRVKLLEGAGARIVGQSYKVTPRTAELVDRLAEQYGTRGHVLAACAYILAAGENMKVTRVGATD